MALLFKTTTYFELPENSLKQEKSSPLDDYGFDELHPKSADSPRLRSIH